MSNSTVTVLAVLAAVLSMVAVGLALVSLRDVWSRRGRAGSSPLPNDLAGLREEVQRLRTESEVSIRHLGMVRYDAFGDMGGRLSWSVALADDRGDGVVLTSISGRSDARTYAKNITGWASDQSLSPEEQEAVAEAKAAG